MMQKLTLFLFLIFLMIEVNAQDKIITKENDTLNCSILEVTDLKLIFEIDSKGIKSRGDIDRANISGFYLSANSEASIAQSDKSTSKKSNRTRQVTLKGFQFGLNGGYGYLLGSTSASENILIGRGFGFADVQNYYNDFRDGVVVDASVHYLFFNSSNGSVGFGLNHSFMTSNQGVNGYVNNDTYGSWGGDMEYGRYAEQYYTNYTNISLYAKKRVGGVYLFIEDAVGVVFYRNELQYLNSPMLITSLAFGSKSKLGMEIPVSSNLLIDFHTSFFYSSLNWFKMNNGYSSQTVNLDLGSRESLSRLELSLGLKYIITKKPKL